jgi:hypothetical protein
MNREHTFSKMRITIAIFRQALLAARMQLGQCGNEVFEIPKSGMNAACWCAVSRK